MKPTIIAILILISATTNAQTTHPEPSKIRHRHETAWGKPAASISCDCDTLTIDPNTTLKWIKIGNKVYRIVPHETTIEEVQPTIIPGTPWGPNMTPAVGDTIWDESTDHGTIVRPVKAGNIYLNHQNNSI